MKDCLINLIAPQQEQNLIDLAGGTGDIATRFLKRGGGAATICDINPAMMRAGQNRPANHQFANKSCNRLLHWVAGDASQLPFAENSTDIITIAFGLRNVPQRHHALSEIYRVLKPSGRFFCLEFSHPRRRPISALYGLWSQLLPGMGALIAQDAAAYRYLVESIKQFPDQETLAAMLGEAGFAPRAPPRFKRRHRRHPLRLEGILMRRIIIMRPNFFNARRDMAFIASRAC